MPAVPGAFAAARDTALGSCPDTPGNSRAVSNTTCRSARRVPPCIKVRQGLRSTPLRGAPSLSRDGAGHCAHDRNAYLPSRKPSLPPTPARSLAPPLALRGCPGWLSQDGSLLRGASATATVRVPEGPG